MAGQGFLKVNQATPLVGCGSGSTRAVVAMDGVRGVG